MVKPSKTKPRSSILIIELIAERTNSGLSENGDMEDILYKYYFREGQELFQQSKADIIFQLHFIELDASGNVIEGPLVLHLKKSDIDAFYRYCFPEMQFPRSLDDLNARIHTLSKSKTTGTILTSGKIITRVALKDGKVYANDLRKGPFDSNVSSDVIQLSKSKIGNYSCPKCDNSNCKVDDLTIYIEIIYLHHSCSKCGYHWDRAYCFLDLTPSCDKLSGFDQQAEVIYMLKKQFPRLEKKIQDSPINYQNYKRKIDVVILEKDEH